MKTHRIICAFHLVFLIGCTAGKGGDCDNTSATGYRTIESNGVEREYILHTPDSYDSNNGEAVPLVLNFHGNGGCASFFQSDESGLDAVANSNSFLIAYPQGVARAKGLISLVGELGCRCLANVVNLRTESSAA